MAEMPDTGMVLAAGLGTRMRPLTDTLPKALVPLRGKPLIDWSIDQYRKSGIGVIVVNSHYLAEKLEVHLADRKDVEIRISREEALLETGGGITKALPLLGEKPFFTANCDGLWFDSGVPLLERMAAAFDGARMDALLALQPVENAVGYEGKGDFFLADDGRIRLRGDAPLAPYVYTGIQLVHPRLFAGCKAEPFPLRRLFRPEPPEGWLARFAGIVHTGKWLHVGDPQGLAAAEAVIGDQ